MAMELLESLKERAEVIAAVAVVAGIGIGLLFGYVIAPVEWVDGTPEQLREDLRVDYLRMTIATYSQNQDVDKAIARYQALGEHAADALAAVGASPEGLDPTAIQNFHAVVEVFETNGARASGGTTGAAEEAREEAGMPGWARGLIIGAAIAGVVGVAVAGVFFMRARLSEDEFEDFAGLDEEISDTFDRLDSYPTEDAEVYTEPEAPVDVSEPLATFRTSYTLGEDLYDDSFSIESPAGEFLGECGVGIGDVIGVGEPKKVSACEIWLFDKNDIQTVTKVLTSEYAFDDEETMARLSSKGEPVLAESGKTILLQTASLEVEARVVDVVYGQGALPAKSFFERVTIELTAYARVLDY
jgi:hypothetical protein